MSRVAECYARKRRVALQNAHEWRCKMHTKWRCILRCKPGIQEKHVPLGVMSLPLLRAVVRKQASQFRSRLRRSLPPRASRLRRKNKTSPGVTAYYRTKNKTKVKVKTKSNPNTNSPRAARRCTTLL